jgi:CRISPR-associated protein Cmr4
MNESRLIFIHALSPVHAGTGQGVGVIDLPVAREKATNLPYLPGSTLKGTLRDNCGDDALRDKIFGKGGDSTGSSGSAIFTDQRLLCLPVRSLFGTFAWVTSRYILERFKRDCESVGDALLLDTPEVKNEKCFVASGSALKNNDNKVILEDLDLTASEASGISDWADFLSKKIFPDNTDWQNFFRERFCVVSDDVMNFLAETATEVKARNVLSDNKTSDNLWYEEALPTETILSGILATVEVNAKAVEVFKTVKNLCEKPLQLGGNMTVGRGLCRAIVDGKGGTGNANS